MESALIVGGMGPWRNFDEIEEFLTVDELMLLHDSYARHKHSNYRMLGSLQGIDLGEFDEGDSSEDEFSGLPPEIAEHERKHAERKAQMLAANKPEADALSTFGLGYVKK